MENNTNTTMVALDLSDAFDTVNHKILLEVPNKYFEIQENALKWIRFMYKLQISSLRLRPYTSQFLRGAFWALYSSYVMLVLYKNFSLI